MAHGQHGASEWTVDAAAPATFGRSVFARELILGVPKTLKIYALHADTPAVSRAHPPGGAEYRGD